MNRRPFLRQSLDVRLSQRLSLTPSLLQKIELLQLNKLELQEMLNQELMENPILEEVFEQDEPKDVSLDISMADDSVEDKTASDGAEAFDEIDFRYFFEDYLDTGFNAREQEASERPGFETFLARPPSLEEHLRWQLGLMDVKPKVAAIVSEIIGNLDENGYLAIALDELCLICSCTMRQAENALRIVQEMDPVGIGARDLRECLLLQLNAVDLRDSLAWIIIDEHLALLEQRKYKEIAAATGNSFDDVLRAVECVKKLIPKPGQKYANTQTNYVQPEVAITKVDGEFVILLNDEGIPQLRLNNSYRDLLKSNGISGETKDFLRDKFRSAVDLLRSVSQRKQTIYKVCVCIVNEQKDFLEKGQDYLKPLLIKKVAEIMGVHSSTISRVVTNKYVDTPQGVMELRKFFTMGVDNLGSDGVSIVQAKSKLRKFIEEENRKKPYSDSQLCQMLRRENVDITRRTVAKYREQMKIPGSRDRKSGYLV